MVLSSSCRAGQRRAEGGQARARTAAQRAAPRLLRGPHAAARALPLQSPHCPPPCRPPATAHLQRRPVAAHRRKIHLHAVDAAAVGGIPVLGQVLLDCPQVLQAVERLAHALAQGALPRAQRDVVARGALQALPHLVPAEQLWGGAGWGGREQGSQLGARPGSVGAAADGEASRVRKPPALSGESCAASMQPQQAQQGPLTLPSGPARHTSMMWMAGCTGKGRAAHRFTGTLDACAPPAARPSSAAACPAVRHAPPPLRGRRTCTAPSLVFTLAWRSTATRSARPYTSFSSNRISSSRAWGGREGRIRAGWGRVGVEERGVRGWAGVAALCGCRARAGGRS